MTVHCVNARGRLAVAALLLASCRARPASTDAPNSAPESAAPAARSADAAEPDAEPDPRTVDGAAPAAAPSFAADTWLLAHGAAWKHDAPCWQKLTPSPSADDWFNDCSCSQAVVLTAPVRADLLVCSRHQDLKEARLSPLLRTAVYAVKDGRLRLVLDVPTAAAIDGEAFGLYASPSQPSPRRPVGDVRLAVTSDGTALVLADQEGAAPPVQPCVEALATADREKLADVRRVYAKVCASIGRWRVVGDRLVHEPAPR